MLSVSRCSRAEKETGEEKKKKRGKKEKKRRET